MIGSCLRTICLRPERQSSANPIRHQPGGKTHGDQDGFTDDRWAATFGGGRHPYRAEPRAASSGSVHSPFLLTIRYHDLLADPASYVDRIIAFLDLYVRSEHRQAAIARVRRKRKQF